MRIGLVGCVKSKLAHAAPARDLYVSALFRGRRCYVERSTDRWFILSAKHGLVDPDQVLELYNETLNDKPRAARRSWSQQVLRAIEQKLGEVSGVEFEVEAGAAYLAHGLEEGLLARRATVVNPTKGMPLGRQLQFYKHASCL